MKSFNQVLEYKKSWMLAFHLFLSSSHFHSNLNDYILNFKEEKRIFFFTFLFSFQFNSNMARAQLNSKHRKVVSAYINLHKHVSLIYFQFNRVMTHAPNYNDHSIWNDTKCENQLQSWMKNYVYAFVCCVTVFAASCSISAFILNVLSA